MPSESEKREVQLFMLCSYLIIPATLTADTSHSVCAANTYTHHGVKEIDDFKFSASIRINVPLEQLQADFFMRHSWILIINVLIHAVSTFWRRWWTCRAGTATVSHIIPLGTLWSSFLLCSLFVL